MSQTGVSYSGNMVLIASKSASASSSITFTSGITSAYNNYFLQISNYLPATANTELLLRVSTDGGSSYIATGYNGGLDSFIWNSAVLTNATNTTGILLIHDTVNSGYPSNTQLWLNNLTSNTGYPMFTGQGIAIQGGNFSTGVICGLYNVTPTTVNAIQLIASSGNITQGKFSLYGLKEF